MPHFDGTITLGNLVTIIVMVVGLVRIWTKTVSRVDEHEKWIHDHMACNRQQIRILNELRRSFAYVCGVLKIRHPEFHDDSSINDIEDRHLGGDTDA